MYILERAWNFLLRSSIKNMMRYIEKGTLAAKKISEMNLRFALGKNVIFQVFANQSSLNCPTSVNIWPESLFKNQFEKLLLTNNMEITEKGLRALPPFSPDLQRGGEPALPPFCHDL